MTPINPPAPETPVSADCRGRNQQIRASLTASNQPATVATYRGLAGIHFAPRSTPSPGALGRDLVRMLSAQTIYSIHDRLTHVLSDMRNDQSGHAKTAISQTRLTNLTLSDQSGHSGQNAFADHSDQNLSMVGVLSYSLVTWSQTIPI